MTGRVLVAVLIGGVCMALTGCGEKTATLQIMGPNSGSLDIVMTGSASTIDAFKSKVEAQTARGSSLGYTANTVDADQHTGPKLCETDVTDNGVTYHVAVYSTLAAFTSDVCTQIAQTP